MSDTLGRSSMSKKIEDVITGILKGDKMKNALDFIAHLRGDAGVSITKDDNDEGRWWIRDKSSLICEMQIKVASDDSPEAWEVWFYGDCLGEHASMADEGINNIAWSSITFCRNCGAECAPGKRKTVFGKAFEKVCQSTLGFTNPEAHVLICMKKIIDYR